jgi:hypothetical protein
MHGGASTGPRTPEGLERCRRARWKHGRYSASAKAEKKAMRSRRGWLRQFNRVFSRIENLWGLLFKIADQLDDGQDAGLASTCQRALRMWDECEAVLANRPVQGAESPPRPNKPARAALAVRAMLEMGAAGRRAADLKRLVLKSALQEGSGRYFPD